MCRRSFGFGTAFTAIGIAFCPLQFRTANSWPCIPNNTLTYSGQQLTSTELPHRKAVLVQHGELGAIILIYKTYFQS